MGIIVDFVAILLSMGCIISLTELNSFNNSKDHVSFPFLEERAPVAANYGER